MNIVFRSSTRDELEELTAKLDEEFIASKGRSISLSARFPDVLTPRNAEHVLVGVDGSRVVASLAVRPFDWWVNDRTWRGAMVAMVWVDREYRGKGLAGALLGAAARHMRGHGADFGILWTGKPAVYARAGWFQSDRGLVGELAADSGNPAQDVTVGPPDAEWLEALRRQVLPMGVARSESSYRHLPIPAKQVLCFSNARDGYALVGHGGDIGYLYEVVGQPSLWTELVAACCRKFGKIFVNTSDIDPFATWLRSRNVELTAQSKAMWTIFSDRVGLEDIRTWHVPYFDWV